jgi:hypothetical protein
VLAALCCFALTATARAELYYLIVSGIGGDARYEEQFATQTANLADAARRTAGDDARVEVLSGDAATRDAVVTGIETLAAKTGDTDTVAVFLVGHGSFDGEQYKFNLPGPDVTGDELKGLLDGIPASAQLVVNATSASGAVLEAWTADGRTVITATRSGAERNATRFAEHWAAALSSDEADTNKNGAITAQEAFDYASRRVADSFESAGTLATEHPQLVGDAAARFNVARLTTRGAATPELENLYSELEGLEAQIDALRLRRDELDPEQYMNELQELLVQLALVQGRIDEAQAR